MRTPEQIRSYFSGFKHQKITTIIEKEIQVYTINEVDCMIEIAQKQLNHEYLHDFIDWHNDHNPKNYIPNLELENYLQETSASEMEKLKFDKKT